MKIKKNCFIICLLFLLGISLFAQNPGAPDRNFGLLGFAVETWEDTSSALFDIGVDSEGNIVVPGYYQVNSAINYNQIYVVKLNDHGNLAPFGNTSRGFMHDIVDEEYALSLKILPGDSLLIAGCIVVSAVNYPFVIKLMSDGQIVEEFGDEGVFSEISNSFIVGDMDIYRLDNSYRILLCGSDRHYLPQLLMIDSQGLIVSDFGTNGYVQLEGFIGVFNNLVIDSDESNLYVSASLYEGGLAIAKYILPEGELDTEFGDGGVVSFTSSEGFNGTANALIFEKEQNTLTIFGDYQFSVDDRDIFAFRMNANDGSADVTFGLSGWSSLRSAGSDETISDAILQSDGKYYFGGSTDFMGDNDFMLGRVKPGGTFDSAFGTNGLVLSDLGTDEFLMGLALSPEEDNIYAAGYIISGRGAAVITSYFTGYEEEQVVKVNENTGITAVLFPNPAKDHVTITSGLTGLHHAQIFDLSGKELLRFSHIGGRFDLPINSLKPSMYFIRVTLPDQQIKSYKLVKQ